MLGQRTRPHTTPQKTFLRVVLLPAMAMAFAAMAHPNSAAASLGGTATTVEADRAKMRAELRMSQKNLYAIHELKALNGVVVREFVSPTGIVFGVAWQGPSRPDLQQLLGGYFPQFTRAAQAQKERSQGRRVLRVEEPDLVVHSGGHARAFAGRAYVPRLVPAGVQSEEIQ